MKGKSEIFNFNTIVMSTIGVLSGLFIDIHLDIFKEHSDISLIILFVILILLITLLVVVNIIKKYKEISKTPINNLSSRYLYMIFKRLERMINKLNRCKNKQNFTIKVPYYDRNQRKVLLSTRKISGRDDPYLSYVRDEFINLKRILLELGQNKLRIKMGEFLSNYFGFPHSSEANIDYIGWTKLLNESPDGMEDIKNEIENLIETHGNKVEGGDYINANEIALKISRAYRHLGTTYYTYRFLYDSKNELQEYIENAFNWMAIANDPKKPGIHINDDFLKSEFIENFKKQYTRLAVGIKYNNCLRKYYCSLDLTMENEKEKRNDYLGLAKDEITNLYNAINESFDSKEKSIEELDNKLYDKLTEPRLIKEFIKYNCIDDHRKVKIYSLYAEIFADDPSEASNISNASRKIKEILDDNIYIDEAMEMFVFNEINKLKK